VAKKNQQKKNAHRHPGIHHSEDYALQMVYRDGANLLHPMREHGVPGHGKHRDSGQHKDICENSRENQKAPRLPVIGFQNYSPQRHRAAEKTERRQKTIKGFLCASVSLW